MMLQLKILDITSEKACQTSHDVHVIRMECPDKEGWGWPTDPPIDGVVVHHAHDRAEGLVELPQPVRGVLPSINSGHSQVHEPSGGPGKVFDIWLKQLKWFKNYS